MAIDTQCFTKIVKNDFKSILNFIKMPLLGLLAIILLLIIIPFETLYATMLPHAGLISIIMLNLGILCMIYDAIKDPLNAPQLHILVILSTLIACGALGTTCYAVQSSNNAIISCISIAFTICLIPFMHGYIKCKQV